MGIESVEGNDDTDDTICDLLGRKLNAKHEKGAYIQGGKKYI